MMKCSIHLGLHYLLRLKQLTFRDSPLTPKSTQWKVPYFNIVSICMGKSIRIQRVNTLVVVFVVFNNISVIPQQSLAALILS